MYYSKQQLANLYKKYFYGEYGENDTNIYIVGGKKQSDVTHQTLENTTKTQTSSTTLGIGQGKYNDTSRTSDSSIAKTNQHFDKGEHGPSSTPNTSSNYRKLG